MESISKSQKEVHLAIEIIAQRMTLDLLGHGSSAYLRSKGAVRGRRWNHFRKTQKRCDYPILSSIVAAWRLGLIRSSLVWYSLYLTDHGSCWLRRYSTRAQMIELSYGCMALKAMKGRLPGPSLRFKLGGSIPEEEREKT
uniref:Alpha-V2 n=1 Tax=Melon chlorotic mosaic alphasatellite TaxID=2169825 RepID=A0A089YJT8_9VIRU|nr:alpha-V2 [Melon chlorotic mosaic alphasatellite]AIR91949.1 alpha-V2 [Melon chlorotic mosaic alphasatellite]AIR91951.1 alpha-V2 [Melon chlorotic mosaic alphasatellite]